MWISVYCPFAGVRLRGKTMDSRCRGDSLLVVCRTEAAVCRLGNNRLGADMSIAAHKHLTDINLFFLMTSPLGLPYCFSYYTNDQRRQEVSPVWSGCSLHGHLSAGLLWGGWCGVLPTTPGERLCEVSGAEHTAWQPSNSLEYPANIWGFGKATGLLRCWAALYCWEI